jgi:uncharacterized LabA/DUF88 family protein
MGKTAILVDGGFYSKRVLAIYGKLSPEEKVANLMTQCFTHLKQKDGQRELYRIFYYDCPPLGKKVQHPLSGDTIDFSKTEQYLNGMAFLALMKQQRKVALRLGRLRGSGSDYVLPSRIVKKLCAGTLSFDTLKPNDFILDVKQKGVDMRIGVDIASLAYKRQVEQIILIAGDGDFVPAAKTARREGIDFILDPMWNNIPPDLAEHIDGLATTCKKPKSMRKGKERQPSDTL